MHDPEAMLRAAQDDLAAVLTTCIRADRFCDGAMAEMFESELMTRVVLRADALLADLDTKFGGKACSCFSR